MVLVLNLLHVIKGNYIYLLKDGNEMKEVNIVVQFKDGNLIEGTSENFFPGIERFLLDTTSGEAVEINMENWLINFAKMSKKISVMLSEIRLDV